jgi:osmotically-inducible protein OsmY
VRAIANDIVVELAFDAKRTDAEVAETALATLKASVTVPVEAITPVVRDGWITLDGQVSTWFQKNAAEMALSGLRGVKGISNNITICSTASVADVKAKIEEAFRRHAHIHANKIRVQAIDGTVTLEGEVPTWQERQQAEVAAWQAPGVSQVIDKLSVQP